LPSVGACAESFNRSNSLRRIAGSTHSSRPSRARPHPVRPGRHRVVNMPLLTSVRIEAVIVSSVV
jgi:hypothetical protein